MPLLLVSPPDARFLKGGTENTLLIHIECLCRADLEAVAAADALIGLVGLALLDLDALMPADILAAAAADTLGSVSVGGLVGIGQLILPFFVKSASIWNSFKLSPTSESMSA